MQLAACKEEIQHNLGRFAAYLYGSDPEQRSFARDLLRRGRCFVKFTEGGKICFCPSRFAGYTDNSRARHFVNTKKDGKLTNPAICDLLGHKNCADEQSENEFLHLLKSLGLNPHNRDRTYWRFDRDLREQPERHSAASEFSAWTVWHARHELSGLKCPGVYILAHLESVPAGNASPTDPNIIYFGETHGASQSLKKRLDQFNKAAFVESYRDKIHSGGISYQKKFGSRVADLYVAVLPVDIESLDGIPVSFYTTYLESSLLWQHVLLHGCDRLLNKG